MTQKEKQLLFKDLCARLPYGVMYCCKYYSLPIELQYLEVNSRAEYLVNGDFFLQEIKLYLRPMSSMTEEEKYTYRHMLGATLNSEKESIMFVYVEDFPTVIDWLNAHHFDYRGLIDKGLALEAPEGLYNSTNNT